MKKNEIHRVIYRTCYYPKQFNRNIFSCTDIFFRTPFRTTNGKGTTRRPLSVTSDCNFSLALALHSIVFHLSYNIETILYRILLLIETAIGPIKVDQVSVPGRESESFLPHIPSSWYQLPKFKRHDFHDITLSTLRNSTPDSQLRTLLISVIFPLVECRNTFHRHYNTT